jgi:hypothetical protein
MRSKGDASILVAELFPGCRINESADGLFTNRAIPQALRLGRCSGRPGAEGIVEAVRRAGIFPSAPHRAGGPQPFDIWLT